MIRHTSLLTKNSKNPNSGCFRYTDIHQSAGSVIEILIFDYSYPSIASLAFILPYRDLTHENPGVFCEKFCVRLLLLSRIFFYCMKGWMNFLIYHQPVRKLMELSWKDQERRTKMCVFLLSVFLEKRKRID